MDETDELRKIGIGSITGFLERGSEKGLTDKGAFIIYLEGGL